MGKSLKGKVKTRYRGSWTHRSGKADSLQSDRSACEVGYNQANLHTPVLPARTAGELVEKMKQKEENR